MLSSITWICIVIAFVRKRTEKCSGKIDCAYSYKLASVKQKRSKVSMVGMSKKWKPEGNYNFLPACGLPPSPSTWKPAGRLCLGFSLSLPLIGIRKQRDEWLFNVGGQRQRKNTVVECPKLGF